MVIWSLFSTAGYFSLILFIWASFIRVPSSFCLQCTLSTECWDLYNKIEQNVQGLQVLPVSYLSGYKFETEQTTPLACLPWGTYLSSLFHTDKETIRNCTWLFHSSFLWFALLLPFQMFFKVYTYKNIVWHLERLRFAFQYTDA